jgi:hypothetical protein
MAWDVVETLVIFTKNEGLCGIYVTISHMRKINANLCKNKNVLFVIVLDLCKNHILSTNSEVCVLV